MYLIVLLPNLKRTYDLINLMEKLIRALYRKLVLFLQQINDFHYIPENESEGGILGWNKSNAIIIPIMDHIVLTCNSITLPLHVDQFMNHYRIFHFRSEHLSWTLLTKASTIWM